MNKETSIEENINIYSQVQQSLTLNLFKKLKSKSPSVQTLTLPKIVKNKEKGIKV